MVLAITALLATAARAAEVEPLCLRDCRAAGNPTAICQTQVCAYTRTAQPTPSSLQPGTPTSLLSRSRQFDPPTPIHRDSQVLPSPTGAQVQAVTPLASSNSGAPSFAPPAYATPKLKLTPTKQALGPSTNYACRDACLRNHYQFTYCQNTCSY